MQGKHTQPSKPGLLLGCACPVRLPGNSPSPAHCTHFCRLGYTLTNPQNVATHTTTMPSPVCLGTAGGAGLDTDSVMLAEETQARLLPSSGESQPQVVSGKLELRLQF